MSHTNEHTPHSNAPITPEPDLAGIEAAMDRLARLDASRAGDDFEARMASTTQFTLMASSNTRAARQSVDRGVRRIGWQKIAAVLLLSAIGTFAWTMSRHMPGAPTVHEPAIAVATPATGDDSEVFSLVALALDDGNGSEIDFLLKETAELDTKITDWTVPSDESAEGSTM